MTIRSRLSLWYAAIMFICLFAMGVLTYREFAPEPRTSATCGAKEPEREADEADFAEALRNLLWCGLPAALLALGGGWWLMRRALAPVNRLCQAAERVTERNLGEQLPRTANGDELDRLTEVFNAMTKRLGESFQRVREFTLHASHELKTPLTVMRGELETALAEGTPSGLSRDWLLGQLDEVQRLTVIVDGLTLLTKADAGQIPLNRERVALAELVRDSFGDAQILAHPGAVRVELVACDELSVDGDRHRLRQLLLNLVDNAVKYNHPQGLVTMSLRRVDANAEIAIANTGPGIAPELLPRVFDRFFRGDRAHNQAVEGCGLGLSIAQWIASAHGGTIRVASEPSKLTTFTITLPLASSNL